LTQLIQDVIILLKNKEDFSSRKQIVFEGMTDHLILSGNEEQIKQVVWNLCINALEAMSERALTLKLKEVFSFQSGVFYASHRGMVLEVQDEGCGIAFDQITNIYDPFYSSKKDGVGLGLATVYQIINQSGGAMDVNSTVGKGTLFTIFLPDQENSFTFSIIQNNSNRGTHNVRRRTYKNNGY
jgi:two-component system sensor histidine kinase PilS (NtrC family)